MAPASFQLRPRSVPPTIPTAWRLSGRCPRCRYPVRDSRRPDGTSSRKGSRGQGHRRRPGLQPGAVHRARNRVAAAPDDPSRDEFEVIYVDDGSTDETPARLDALAAEHPHIRVFHEPNSGWAGRPRNVGIRQARGEYIQFIDQDDALTPDALRRLHEMAARNRLRHRDRKVASNFRPVPQHLFRQNVDSCTIHDTSLISSLTPHKMFRTAFLREHGIEFPEGRRRLEDQLFMVRAYLAGADRVDPC